MAFSLGGGKQKRRDHVVAVDLGSRSSKAVYLQRKGETYTLSRFALLDAPVYEKGMSGAVLGEHLKAIMAALEPKTKQITMAVGVQDSILRNAELPQVPIPDMRLMLKYNTKNYLQQELTDYVFDCHIVPPKIDPTKPETAKLTGKYKVWVAGAKAQFINELQTGTRAAGFLPDQVTLSVLGPINAFELSNPEQFSKDVVALVDVGFRNSTISIVSQGELVISRVVGIGGDKLTTGLAEALGVTYAEAEGIKVGMPQEVESSLQPLLSPLGRELRASIDFFEHQQDRTVSEVFLSGGAARSEFFVQALQSELMVQCKTWNPAASFSLGLPPQQMGEVEQVAPQLTVAIGAAAASF